MAVSKKKADEKQPIVIQQITVQSVDRSQKDVGEYRTAHRSAENIYNPNRTKLYDMYDDILTDSHLDGIIDKRILTVLNHPLWFEVDKKKNEKIGELIVSKRFRDMLKQIMLQKFWGITGIEFIPGYKFDFADIPRKHIKPDTKTISFQQSMPDGISYENNTLIWVIGDKKDLGKLLKCAYLVLYKRGNMGDWAQYIELFGIPMTIAKYDGNDVKTKVLLQQAIEDAGSALRLMIPKQAEIDVKDGKASNGNGELQNKFHDVCNAEMSKCILGNTETTEGGKGGGSTRAGEHGRQQDEIIKADLIDVQNELNSDQFKDILRTYGFDIPENGKFVFEKWVDQYELAARMTVDKLFPAPLNDDYFYETYNRPKPDNYDELKEQKEQERLAKINHMNSSGLSTDNNGNADGTDDEDDSDGEENNLRKTANDKKAKANLSKWHKLRAALANFFDHGHED